MSATEAVTATEVPAEGAEALTGAENASQGPPGEAPTGPETGNGTDDGDRHLSREQATYRRRMKAAETERDSLREERDSLRAQLERVQTAEVERLASVAGLSVPGDVWVFGASLDTLRTETGEIDADTVDALVGDIVKSRPGMKAPPMGTIGVGRGASAVPREFAPKVGLSSLLKPT